MLNIKKLLTKILKTEAQTISAFVFTKNIGTVTVRSKLIKIASITSASYTSLGTLNEAFRPQDRVYAPVRAANDGNTLAMLRIEPTGDVAIKLSSAVSVSNQYVFGAFSYSIYGGGGT